MTIRRSMAAFALMAGLGATSAPATDWESVGGWDVHEIDARRCVVGRTFAQTGTTFGIIMSIDGEVRVFATAPNWPTRANQPSAGAVLLDGQAMLAGPAVGIEQQGNRGFVAAATPEFLGRFSAAQQIGLHAGPGTDMSALPLAGNAAGLAQGRRCLDALREDARGRTAALSSPQATFTPTPGFGAAPPRATPASAPVAGFAAKAPVPRGSRAAWMNDAEYPEAALRAGEQGSVTVKLAVNTQGQVAACDVVKSSGSRSLDAQTCRTLQRRARYAPATDGGGQAVAGADQHTVRWQLPE